ncbi:ABC transporter ATP-binding protein [Marinilactibacillus psychrotolerans]|uniref:ABC transporter ATP-binding protein n=1 Tax=Marinilactibacillus psychrotolerans TaxID=191770 RepID=A0A5R9C2H1_9LACT|nr:ABC transporter ATP-binding protein [Marinilactibacillus psychrotolerans]TLQ06932.1 ABC transporter ATP-binding protein [Marinilactibacillus psychrotolerans]
MIVMENVVVDYTKFKLNCSLQVNKGMITGLVGENGAGKTTAFKALLGLIPVDSGTAKIDGISVDQLTSENKEKIGTVLSDSFFSPAFTIKDINRLLKNFYQEYDESYFLTKCQEFNLPLNQKIKEFSTGMQGKLKTLTALSHKAQILILDEPTSGLDVSARYEILDILQEYLDKYPESCVLISSHISTDLERICDDIYYLKQGKVLLHEDTDVLLDTYGILKVEETMTDKIDQSFLLYRKRTTYGYDYLTNQMSFYKENYANLIIEKPSIDQILLMVMGGEEI